MDKTLWRLPGLWISVALALAALPVRVIPSGYGMTALTLLALAVVVLFYTLALHGRRKRLLRWGTAALALCLALFLAAEIPVVRGMQSDSDNDADFLVVMGAGIRGTQPSQSMLDRLTVALDWLNDHPNASVIVSGSQAPDEAASEASVMAAWLAEQDVAPGRILLEDKADSTRENIVNSYAVAAQHGGGRVAFVSSEYHLCRMRMLIRALGFEPVCLAAHTSHPSLMVNYAIREAFAIWQIWLFGA